MGSENFKDLKFIQFLTLDKLKGLKHFLSKDGFMINEGNDVDDWEYLKKGVLCGFAMYLNLSTNQLHFFPVKSSEFVFGKTSFNELTDINYKENALEIIEDVKAERELH